MGFNTLQTLKIALRPLGICPYSNSLQLNLLLLPQQLLAIQSQLRPLKPLLPRYHPHQSPRTTNPAWRFQKARYVDGRRVVFSMRAVRERARSVCFILVRRFSMKVARAIRAANGGFWSSMSL